MAKALVDIRLGTDGASSNNNLDLFEEMKFASLLQKSKAMDPTAAPAEEIFNIATANNRVGEGKPADLVLIDLDRVASTPGHNLISDLVYSVSGDGVSDVICDGKIIMRDGKIEGAKKIIEEAKRRAKNLVK